MTTMRYTTVLLIVAAAVLTEACSSSAGKDTQADVKTEAVPVKVMTLSRQDIHPEIKTSGRFTTDDETYLSFKTGGVIGKIYVKEGDAIRRGQLLATLNLTEINAQVRQAQLAHDKASRDFQRVSNLYRDSVATLEQFQNARTGLELAAQQLEAAKFNQHYSEIRAVGDGYVLRKMASEGQVIESGTPVVQTNGAHRGKWILRAGVSDREWAWINVQDQALVSGESFGGQTLRAVVARKSESTDPATGLFTIELEVLGKTPVALASGMFGKAIISTSRTQSVWTIPYDAILDADATTGYVFVTPDHKKAYRVQIDILSIDRDHVLVARGLEQAESLIVSGSAYLRDQANITILP